MIISMMMKKQQQNYYKKSKNLKKKYCTNQVHRTKEVLKENKEVKKSNNWLIMKKWMKMGTCIFMKKDD